MGIRENIIRLREEHDLTQEQLAKIAGVSRGAVSQWEGGFSEPRMGSIQKMADHFGLSKSNIIEEDGMVPGIHRLPVTSGPRATVPLRTLGRVHAGDAADEEEVSELVDVPASVALHHPRAFALVVEGDCMDRVVLEGYHVLVDPDVEPHNGSVVVAELEPGRAVMRRWLRGQDTLVLSADSRSRHEDIVVTLEDDPVRVVGTVVWAQTAEEMD